MKSLTLNGITYEIVSEKPYKYNGFNRASLTLRRLRGRRTYFSVRYENGHYSSVVGPLGKNLN